MVGQRRLAVDGADAAAAALRKELAAVGWPVNQIAEAIAVRFPGISRLKAHRLARGWTRPRAVELLADLVRADGLCVPATLSASRLYDWERGSRRPASESLDLLCRLYETRADRLGFGMDYTPSDADADAAPRPRRSTRPGSPGSDEAAGAPSATGLAALELVESLRHDVTDVLATSTMTDAGLDDWEYTVLAHGRDTRHVPPPILLSNLAADMAELRGVLARRQPASTSRRLTLVTAQMAGLMSLTLIRLGENAASRSWARTARLAADEAGDPAVQSWVRAQEAYTLFYAANLQAAIEVAAHAQALAGAVPCVGTALASALKARAHAALGDRRATHEALDNAMKTLAALDPKDVVASAFGYNEAQLRFHEGNAWTALHDTSRAWAAQDRALALYPHSDWMDRTFVHLDHAACLAHDGEVEAGVGRASQALLALPDAHRTGLILQRARRLADSIPPGQRALPAVRDFRDVLALPASAPRLPEQPSSGGEQ
jgi:tetratricopeptide (TPR) repeat protein